MLDTGRIDERIRRLRQLKEILADPETAKLAREVLTSANGIRRFPRTKNAKGGRKGDLAKAVSQAARSVRTDTFTKNTVLQALNERSFAFASAKPEVAVGQALHKLCKKGKLKLVKEGQGREPNLYSN